MSRNPSTGLFEESVPGELLVELHEGDAGERLAIDKALDRIAARTFTPVFRDAAAGQETSRHFRLQIENKASIEEAIRHLESLTGVVAGVSPNYYRTMHSTIGPPGGPPGALPRHLEAIGWRPDLALNNLNSGTPGPTVAVLDTGIVPHPLLNGKITGTRDMVDVAQTSPPPDHHWAGDAAQRDDQAVDEVGHGTHIAGLIAATPGNGISGICPSARLLVIRVLATALPNAGGPPTGFATARDVADAIELASSSGARIINMSFGFPRATPPEQIAVRRAQQRGALLVASVGNHGPGAPRFFPAAYPDVLCVGSIDLNGAVAAFSQRGPHLGCVSPGVDIPSTAANGGVETRSGTSMSAALVSGAAALLLQLRPALTTHDVLELLRRTAGGVNGQPDDRGFGRINLGAAIQRLGFSLT